MTDSHTGQLCPDESRWHDYVDERHIMSAHDRETLDAHLDECAACTAAVEDQRRFRTLLLRTRVNGLDETQWQVLDERMQVMGSEYVPPQSRFGRYYWGVAAAAAVFLLSASAWVLLERNGDLLGDSDVVAASPDIRGRRLGALRAGVVEGRVEVADRSGAWRPLQEGDELREGMSLRPISAEGAQFSVPGHTRIRLAAKSELRLLSADGHAFFVRIRQGEAGFQVDKRAHGQRFAVMAGRFRVAVVGTEFVVQHGERSTVTVQVSEGAVRVDEADDPRSRISETTTVVRSGNRWHFAAGRIDFGPMETPLRALPRKIERLTVEEKQAEEAPAAAQAAAGAATGEPAPDARPGRAEKATTGNRIKAVTSPATPRGRQIIIRIPPQGMSKEEVERLKRIERLLYSDGGQVDTDASTDMDPPR